jgi:SAM-dependent methyltransferase
MDGTDRGAAFANVEQAEFWSEMAPTWLALEDQLQQVGGPPGELAMDRLGLRPGQRVVDLGCGSGRTTLELAARVGSAGEVVGADISAEMLARGRERAARLGAGNVEFVHADVQVHNFGEARFDAAYSRFGVMFFADPVAAFANVRRALRPGGTLSFVCWQTVSDNEWMLLPGMAVAEVTGSLPPRSGPGEPGPFSLSDPARTRALLAAAGLASIAITPHSDYLVIDEDRIPEVALTRPRRARNRGNGRDCVLVGAGRQALGACVPPDKRPGVEQGLCRGIVRHRDQRTAAACQGLSLAQIMPQRRPPCPWPYRFCD